MPNRFREALKGLAFGPATFPQQCAIGLRDPQSEVSVWLHGWGPPRDVTYNNVVAAARPLTIAIGFESELNFAAARKARLILRFLERGAANRLLGEISLRLKETLPAGSDQVGLFETGSCKNTCIPKRYLWARYLYYAYHRWRSRNQMGSNVPMVGREVHCLFVFYICPRPVVLASVREGNASNIFPMDLVGPVGREHFSLALHSTSAGVPLLERSRQVALSSVPIEQASIAYELGKNHNVASVSWDGLPMSTTRSAAFGLPVPRFALRVQEMRIEDVRAVGSHKFFLARAIEDQEWADGLQLFFIHGFYRAWRQRMKVGAAPLARGG